MTAADPQADTKLAVRLVVDGLLDEATARAVIAKVQELTARGKPLTAGEICIRKGWLTSSEARWLPDVNAPPADLLPGLQLKGLLGQGGMSRVFAGIDEETGTEVAVKVLHARLRRDEKSTREFKAEGRLLISLEHENIVRGFYVHEHDGVVYQVMEKVDGSSVQEILDEHGTFQEEPALYIILQTARALTYLHEHGLVHRDIKPGNILIDQQNTVKICDLGLATHAGLQGDDGDSTAGTAHYIAPEQALGKADLDVRSDIYALGVTLYQLTIGKLPFDAETNQETMAQRLMDELRSPELQGVAISPHLSYFIRKMMARDREVRYQDPHELIQGIEEQIEGARSLTAQPGKLSAGARELGKPFDSKKVVRRRPGQRPGARPSTRRRR